MSPEGSNKSEELLKRYAKERQEQAPNLPLHPATRRLLQGEVTRQFGKKSALENRGWSAWFGVMRGRLAIGTALGAVVVTGACLWWNNQKSRPMEMAKAEPSPNELALRPQPRSDAVKLKVEKSIAALDAPARARFEDEMRLRAPVAPAEKAIEPNPITQPGNASVTAVTRGQSTLALDGLAVATTSTFAFTKSLDRGGDLGAAFGIAPTGAAFATAAAPLASVVDGVSLTNSASRMLFGGTATGLKNATNETGLALTYNSPVADPSSLPPSAALGDNERKNLSKLSEATKLAEESLVAPARARGYAGGSRQPALGPPAQTVQPTATTAQPLVARGETDAEKRQQGSTTNPQLSDGVVAQASTPTPKPGEAMTRYFRASAPVANAASKQKSLREMERLAAEPAVLNRFVIEQNGNSVHVVDGDGSVYDGSVEEPVVAEFDSELSETFAEKKDQLAREKPVALQSAVAPRTEDYSFRASGSNVTLRQMVVVNGRFASGTNPAVRRGNAGIAGGSSSLPANAPMPTTKSGTISNRTNGAQRPAFGGRYGFATNQPATIEGTVHIGVTNQQWFRAVRDPR